MCKYKSYHYLAKILRNSIRSTGFYELETLGFHWFTADFYLGVCSIARCLCRFIFVLSTVILVLGTPFLLWNYSLEKLQIIILLSFISIGAMLSSALLLHAIDYFWNRSTWTFANPYGRTPDRWQRRNGEWVAINGAEIKTNEDYYQRPYDIFWTAGKNVRIIGRRPPFQKENHKDVSICSISTS